MQAVKWNSKIQFPSDSNFVVRVTGAPFAPSKSSGNPMITLETEVVSPAEVEIGGQLVSIAGVKCSKYFVTQVLNNGVVDTAKTANKAAELKALYEAFGVDFSTIDPENPDTTMLVGKQVYVQMSGKAKEQRKAPTSAQIAEARSTGKPAMGDIMTNPITGKPLVSYEPQIWEIFGLAN